MSIQFKNQYAEPVIIADTALGNTITQDNIRITDITANSCNIQMQAINSPDNGQEVNKISYIVTENYVVPANEDPAPVEEVEEPAEPAEPPQVTEPTVKPTDEPQVPSRRFNFTTLSSLISLFNEMMGNLKFNIPRR